MLDVALILLVVLPALLGSALALVGAPADRWAPTIAVATTAVIAISAVVVAVPIGGDRPAVSTPFIAGSELSLGVDGLAAAILPMVAIVAWLVVSASTGTPELRTGRFHGLMLVFVAAALMTVLATTLPTLLLSWEVMGATSFALIGYHWRDTVSVASGTTAFLTTRTADLGLYIASGAALAGGAGLGLSSLNQASSGWRDVIAAGLLLAGLGKAAQLPFTFWLSRAMHGPSPVSALLHSAAMVAMGGYLLLRVSPTLAATGWADDATAWVGAGTAVALGAVAIAQSDLKQLLAASTAAQMGFVVLAAGVGATAAGATHLIAHAAVKAGLFLAAGLWLEALGTKRLSALTGAARIWPAIGACAAAGLLSLAGIPPLALWATKDAVLAGALEHSPLLYVTGLLGAALAAGYAGKALFILTRKAPEGVESAWDEERRGTRRVPRRAAMTLIPLAVGGIVLGGLALPPLAAPFRSLVGAGTPEPGVGELVVSALVAIGVLVATGVAMRRRAPGAAFSWPSVLVGWLHLEAMTHRVVVRPTVRLAGLMARADDLILDRAVMGVARTSMSVARTAARLDDVVVDGAVGQVTSAVRRAGAVARRPQTGQLHQYYLQALLVLGIAVVVLVAVR
jgi:NADH:ubiquinone oxidoreductase subunit 5 (subunit L)/multisubunit Na+/H+ antiporter MnhA subunit